MLRISPECVACSLSSGIRGLKYATSDPKLQKVAVKRILEELRKITWDEIPLDLSYMMHEIIAEVTGVEDPYRELKRKSNQAALAKYQEAKKLAMESADPLETAVKLSIAGNLIDYVPYSKVDLNAPFRKVSSGFAINDYEKFKEHVMNSDTLLYFVDNAGEIVFDKLLIEVMIEVRGRPFSKIGLVVKEKPLINDATIEDAREANMLNLPNVEVKFVGNGKYSAPSFKSDEVRSWIEDYDVTVLKGQGNFEIFEDLKGVFFLLVAKCPLISSFLGVNTGDFVLKYSEK
ncbi:MAG: DUF89 family protein [Thaumarchaeota archaeon]|nr:DUF89 family protein [Nitrososphaerota archaeon]